MMERMNIIYSFESESTQPQSACSPTTTMAKSMRSKVKHIFRSKNRESELYTAAEAARLQGLNEKLLQITKTDVTDVAKETEEGEENPGWCLFAGFGLLDPNNVMLESLEQFVPGPIDFDGLS
jgi:hypothetical protein